MVLQLQCRHEHRPWQRHTQRVRIFDKLVELVHRERVPSIGWRDCNVFLHIFIYNHVCVSIEQHVSNNHFRLHKQQKYRINTQIIQREPTPVVVEAPAPVEMSAPVSEPVYETGSVSSGGVVVGSSQHQNLWESGKIEYTGRDSFSNIQAHLDAQLKK